MPASRAGAPAAGGASRGGSSVQLFDDSSTGAPRSPVPHKPARQPSTVSSLTGDSAVGSDDEAGPPQHLGYWGSDWHHELVLKLQIIRDSTAFVTFFILAIVFTGVLVCGFCTPRPHATWPPAHPAPRRPSVPRWACPCTTR